MRAGHWKHADGLDAWQVLPLYDALAPASWRGVEELLELAFIIVRIASMAWIELQQHAATKVGNYAAVCAAEQRKMPAHSGAADGRSR